MIRVILIRHGRTAWNLADGQGPLFRGLVDLPLAEEGVAQAQVTAQRLANEPFVAVYSSPLERAVHTAAIIAEPHSLAVQAMPGLSSMSYGDWAGLSSQEVAQRWPDLYRQWRADPFSIRVPGGESPADLRDRAVAAVCDIVARHRDGETVALISHEAVTRTLACALVGMPNSGYWQIRQDLCNLSRYDYHAAQGAFEVTGLNDTCHLNPALPPLRGNAVRVILIRHGQTAWNEGAGEERFRGRTNLPLDETGRAQARAVAERLKDEPIMALYASPLLRARQTQEALADVLGLPVQTHDGLLDIDYGQFAGLTHSAAAATYPELYRSWRTAPSKVRFPGGESLGDLQRRLLSLFDELSTRHRGQTVALVGHQMVNKVVACTLLGLDLDQIWRIRQDTCGFDLLQHSDGAWHTLCLNDTCHL